MTFSLSSARTICITKNDLKTERAMEANDRHAVRSTLWAVIMLLVLAVVFSSHTYAQDDIDELENGRKIFIAPDGATEYSVQVGQTLGGIRVVRNFPDPSQADPVLNDPEAILSDFSESSYTLWNIEPASAARILQPMPIAPAGETIDIEFIEPGAVTITATGYEQGSGADEVDTVDGIRSHQVVFTFDVEAADANAENNETVTRVLNDNQRSAQSGLGQACNAIGASEPESRSAGQTALLETCDAIASSTNPEGNPAAGLDRIAAEELFAIGDALTVTSDQQIGNIQSRINRVRAGQRTGIDLQSLNFQLWNQRIAGSLLPTHNGAGASQDAIEESNLGIFASGNISVGEVDGKGIQRNADISSNSLTLGADYRVDKQRVFGTAVGIVSDQTEFVGNNNGDMTMQGYSLSIFGTWYEQNKGYADIIAELSQNDFDLTRRINLPGRSDEFANSSTNALRMAVSINMGATFQRGRTEFGPVGKFAITRASIHGFRESSSNTNGGSGTTLDVKSHAVTSIRLTAGGEIKHVFSLSNAVLIPTVRVELELENETDKGAIAATFANDPDNNAMTFTGTNRNRIAMLANVGATAVLKNSQSVFVSLETRAWDDHVSQNRLRLGYRVNF